MSIAPGTKLGRYEIRLKIGEGGMGEVYLAYDTGLQRRVALKILPPNLASNQDRMRRFEQEARAAAALNHPNIAHIYEIGESDNINFIAMEFIDGLTLREKIHKDKPSLAKLLKYLMQAAEGLSKAHGAGIIHRDLKPDNIMVTHDDYAKVLDFGLAKLVEPQRTFDARESGSSEIATAVLPQQSIPGMVMGTVGYMSPEQATGRVKEIDHRSDIFSFGCILFETATGRKAFEGRDVLDSLHQIAHAPTPQISETNPAAPAELQRIVRRCLAKDPDKRYQSIKEVAIELEELLQELRNETEPARSLKSTPSNEAISGSSIRPNAQASFQSDMTAAVEPPRSTSSAEYIVGQIKRHQSGAIIALAVVAVVLAGLGFLLYRIGGHRTKANSPFQIGKIALVTGTGDAWNAAISPDGKFVVYVAGQPQSLWVRDVATNSDVQIAAPAEVQYYGLSFSPDGNYVYYSKREKSAPVRILYQVPKLGGTTKKLLAGVDSSITFSPDGKRFAFVRSSGAKDSALMIANADGTAAHKLFSPDADTFPDPTGPGWAPDDKLIACPLTRTDASGSYQTVVGINVTDGTMKPLTSQRWEDIFPVVWEPDGSGLLMSARERRGTSQFQIWHLSYPGGEGQRLTQGLTAYLSVSLTADSSSLVTTTQETLTTIWAVPLNPSAGTAKQITSGRRDGYCGVAWTNDGKVLFVSRKIANADLWVMNADGSGQKQLTDSQDVERFPSLSPDGRYIIFDLIRAGSISIWRVDSDGNNLKQLTEGNEDTQPHGSPDGKWVVYRGSDSSLWKVSIDGGPPVRLTDRPAQRPVFSPDGKMIACYYHVEANAPWKLALIPTEGGQPLKLFDVALTPGNWIVLRWTPDGRAIFYIDYDRNAVANIWSQPIDGGPPKPVTNFKSDLIYTFDLSRDGHQLILSRGRNISDVVLISNGQ